MINIGEIIEKTINREKKTMVISSFSPTTIGWVAIITGGSAILAVIFLALMATVNPSFGKVNDVFNAIVGVSSVVLAWMLYVEHPAKSPWLSQIALALAVIGAIFTIVGSILIIFGYTDFVLAGWFTGVGYALIGLWLMAFCSSMQPGNTLPHNLVLFGLVVGAFMAVGLIGIPGIIAKIDSMESMPWYLYVAFFGYLGTYILFPIWTIWLGRNLLLK
jgi:hypothetical protein